jgi:signal transduction histidine kinase
MYSVLPAVVSVLFLCYGFYAFASKGVNRISTSFFLLCLTTFFWQASWAVLFQVDEPAMVQFLVKFGYFFILFLPTSLYHFITEISRQQKELRFVYCSYALSAVLAIFLLSSDLFVSGYYHYFWGNYPKAGMLHPVHLLQTFLVITRVLYFAYVTQKHASTDLQMKLRLCIIGTLISSLSALDYLCNYGFEFYPPSVIVTVIFLGIFTIAIVHFDLLNPMTLAGTIAHEMRTPLSTINNYARGFSRDLPILIEGYRLAVSNNLMADGIREQNLQFLSGMATRIADEVKKSNTIIDMLLASTSLEHPDSIAFERYRIGACIAEALDRYPFEHGEKEKISVALAEDFEFDGSNTLLVFVLFNLLKNGIYAMKQAGKGDISISTKSENGRNLLCFTDTGPGIPASVLPRIFDSFYTTKHNGGGAGLGLSFCKKVMTTFKGSITCDSKEGEYTTFLLEFPPA